MRRQGPATRALSAAAAAAVLTLSGVLAGCSEEEPEVPTIEQEQQDGGGDEGGDEEGDEGEEDGG